MRLLPHITEIRRGLSFTSDPVFRGPGKSGLVINHGFEDSASVIERKPNPKREQAGEEQNLAHPGARMKLALRANVKDGDGDRGSKKNGNVDQDGSEPAGLRSAR